MNRSEEIRKAITLTLSFFDLLDYPLTTREIHHYLFDQASVVKETHQGLVDLKKKKMIDSKSGYWFLIGRRGLIDYRKKKKYISQHLKLKVRFVCWLYRLVPYVRMVALSSNLAFNNANDKSDIDLLIITRPDRLWISRLLINGLTALLGQKRRRFRKKDPGRICLSFFLTEKSLNLKQLALNNDPYLFYWLATIKPLLNHGAYSQFLKSNSWALKHIPNLILTSPKTKKKPLSLIAFLGEKTLDFFFPKLNDRLYRWQKNRIKTNLTQKTPAEGLVVERELFKSHGVDYRRRFRDQLFSFHHFY